MEELEERATEAYFYYLILLARTYPFQIERIGLSPCNAI